MVRKFRGRVVDVAKQTIAPGAGSITLSFALPAGYKYNQGAPFYIAYKTGNDKAVKIKETSQNFSEPKFPFEIPVEALQGEGTATIDAVIYFCNDEKDKVCLVHLANQRDGIIQRFLASYRPARPLDHELVWQLAGVEIMRRLIGVAQLPINIDLAGKTALLKRSREFVLNPRQGVKR